MAVTIHFPQRNKLKEPHAIETTAFLRIAYPLITAKTQLETAEF